MKDGCWLLKEDRGGGGNKPPPLNLVVRKTAALGDAIAATVVCDKLIDQGFPVVFQTHPDFHCVLRRHVKLSGVTSPNTFCHINLDGVSDRNKGQGNRYFWDMNVEAANGQLKNLGMSLGPAWNCRPTLTVPENWKAIAHERFKTFPRPWVFICPRSDGYVVRQVPDGIWHEAAQKIDGSKFWLGRHPAPEGIFDLKVRNLDDVMLWLSAADLLCTVDTGPMHMAGAMGIPVLAIYQSSRPSLHLNDQTDFEEIAPDLMCLNCHQNLCPYNVIMPPCQNIDPEKLAAAANRKLRGISGNLVSAVIPILNPPVGRLNRCLESILPQVAEVIVTRDAGGQVPAGALRHDKIRYVQHPERGLGYSRNVNYGARHTCGRWLWLLNDDCYPEPDCLKRLLECAKPGVGLIGHLLRFPNGSIQHGGKYRNPGMRGWDHLGRGGFHPQITSPTEVENVTGASILVDRKAFYDIHGNDEEFFFYCVDDDMCMSLRQKGWKILFTPHACAVHEEAATSRQDPNMWEWVRQACTLFDRKWGWWIDKNINTVPGIF